MEDLKSFQVQEDSAWTVSLGDTQMHIPPPPSGGALLAFILQIMKGLISSVMTITSTYGRMIKNTVFSFLKDSR